MRVGITRVDSSIPLPTYQTAGSVGFDFHSRLTRSIQPGEIAFVPTNVIVRVPDGHVLIIALRSSTPARKGLLMANGVGIIDQDYCGPEDEIQIAVYNISNAQVTVARGERIAQGLVMPVERVEWDERPAESVSRRGFGSTG